MVAEAVSEGTSMPLLDLFWTMFMIFLWVVWIWLLITVFIDIFRDKELNGFAKAMWILFVLVLPFLGVLVYVIVRGNSMHERQAQRAARSEEAAVAYIQETAGSDTGSADEIAKLAQLHKDGVLTDDEFAAQKAKALA
jgi:hypothetical protein